MRSSLLLGVLAFVLLSPGPAGAKVFLGKKEALAWAFPEADRIESRSHVLDDAQKQRVEARARASLDSRLVTVHTAHRDDRVLGHAFIDVHTVRTLPEAILIVVTPEGTVRSLRLLAFHEPSEYQPSQRWLEQFPGRRAGEKLRLGREVHGIAGSTLSAQAVTRAVRRALALWSELVAGKP